MGFPVQNRKDRILDIFVFCITRLLDFFRMIKVHMLERVLPHLLWKTLPFIYLCVSVSSYLFHSGREIMLMAWFNTFSIRIRICIADTNDTVSRMFQGKKPKEKHTKKLLVSKLKREKYVGATFYVNRNTETQTTNNATPHVSPTHISSANKDTRASNYLRLLLGSALVGHSSTEPHAMQLCRNSSKISVTMRPTFATPNYSTFCNYPFHPHFIHCVNLYECFKQNYKQYRKLWCENVASLYGTESLRRNVAAN